MTGDVTHYRTAPPPSQPDFFIAQGPDFLQNAVAVLLRQVENTVGKAEISARDAFDVGLVFRWLVHDGPRWRIRT